MVVVREAILFAYAIVCRFFVIFVIKYTRAICFVVRYRCDSCVPKPAILLTVYIHRLSPRIEWRDLRDAAGLYRLSWRSGGFAFLLFRRSIRRSFHGVNFELPVDQFRGKKKHAAFALRIYMTMVERWIFIRLCRVDKVGELEIFVRERLGKKKFLVIFAFKKFGKKSGGMLLSSFWKLFRYLVVK